MCMSTIVPIELKHFNAGINNKTLLTNPSLYMKILIGSQEVMRTYTLRSNLKPSNSMG